MYESWSVIKPILFFIFSNLVLSSGYYTAVNNKAFIRLIFIYWTLEGSVKKMIDKFTIIAAGIGLFAAFMLWDIITGSWW